MASSALQSFMEIKYVPTTLIEFLDFDSLLVLSVMNKSIRNVICNSEYYKTSIPTLREFSALKGQPKIPGEKVNARLGRMADARKVVRTVCVKVGQLISRHGDVSLLKQLLPQLTKVVTFNDAPICETSDAIGRSGNPVFLEFMRSVECPTLDCRVLSGACEINWTEMIDLLLEKLIKSDYVNIEQQTRFDGVLICITRAISFGHIALFERLYAIDGIKKRFRFNYAYTGAAKYKNISAMKYLDSRIVTLSENTPGPRDLSITASWGLSNITGEKEKELIYYLLDVGLTPQDLIETACALRTDAFEFTVRIAEERRAFIDWNKVLVVCSRASNNLNKLQSCLKKLPPKNPKDLLELFVENKCVIGGEYLVDNNFFSYQEIAESASGPRSQWVVKYCVGMGYRDASVMDFWGITAPKDDYKPCKGKYPRFN